MSTNLPEPVPATRPLAQLREWVGFVHLLARFYMDYRGAVMKASERKTRRAVDVDTRVSADGTMWALHWPTVAKNRLHDPTKKIASTARINELTDDEIFTLRSKEGKIPERLISILHLASLLGIRVEVEVKDVVDQAVVEALINRPAPERMRARGQLQFKTLAAVGDPVSRLRPVHDAGGLTILSFTRYRGKGIRKDEAWPVTDFVRGRPKWI